MLIYSPRLVKRKTRKQGGSSGKGRGAQARRSGNKEICTSYLRLFYTGACVRMSIPL